MNTRRNFQAMTVLLSLAAALLLCGMGHAEESHGMTASLVDPNATTETRNLYINLARMAGSRILFGHQNSTLYGVDWKADPDPTRSDVKAASGKLPAVYGWDLNVLGRLRDADGEDLIAVRIREAHRRGGINTISWHMSNPVTGRNFYDTTPAVEAILPGGSRHAEYRAELDRFAAFNLSLKDENGAPIPIIFRPFHEHTGAWFWWGKGNCSEDEYIALWRFTVEYLRDHKQLRNLLYAYSPAKNHGREAQYLWGYPGDDHVDILGYDHYCQDLTEALPGLRLMVRLARERGKVAAFTETGVPKGLAHAEPGDYFTDRLLKPLRQDETAREIAYLLVWRNANQKTFWVPYEGHALVQDFRRFAADPLIAFEDDLDGVYSDPME